MVGSGLPCPMHVSETSCPFLASSTPFSGSLLIVGGAVNAIKLVSEDRSERMHFPMC